MCSTSHQQLHRFPLSSEHKDIDVQGTIVKSECSFQNKFQHICHVKYSVEEKRYGQVKRIYREQ